MAMRFAHDSAALATTLSAAPDQATFTVSGWVKRVASVANSSTFFELSEDGDFKIALRSPAGSSDLVLTVSTSSGVHVDSASVASLVDGDVFFFAIAVEGAVAKLYFARPGDAALTSLTHGSSVAAFTANSFAVGNSAFASEPPDAVIGPLKVWEASLTAAEVARERATNMPHRFDNLWAWYDCLGVSVDADVSGNGRHLTLESVGGEYGAMPVPYGAPPALTDSVTPHRAGAEGAGFVTLGVTAAGAGAHGVVGAGAAAVAFAGGGEAGHGVAGTGTGAFDFVGSGSGEFTAPSEAYTATGAVSFGFTATGVGIYIAPVEASGAAGIAFVASGIGAFAVSGQGAVTIAFTANGEGEHDNGERGIFVAAGAQPISRTKKKKRTPYVSPRVGEGAVEIGFIAEGEGFHQPRFKQIERKRKAALALLHLAA